LSSNLYFYEIQDLATEWFRSCLTDREKKIEIKSPSNTQNFSNWEIIKHKSSPRISSRAIAFYIYIHNLPPTVKTISEPIIFAVV
jgi:hypothetical protein